MTNSPQTNLADFIAQYHLRAIFTQYMNFSFWKRFQPKKIQGQERSLNKPYMLRSWQDYWDLFSKLINLLNADDKTAIALAFREDERYVNGLTDGWYEFKFAFEKTLQANRDNMNEEQTEIADFLIQKLSYSLANR